MYWISRLIYFHLLGWRLQGDLPPLKKYVIIVAPHTSNADFFLGLLVRRILRTQINYVGKHSLFKAPYGWIFRKLGGAPIDRSKRADTVQQIAGIFQSREQFRLALAPEGTRKKVTAWKSGFYYIALAAEVPIVMVAFDYSKRKVSISEPIWPSGTYAEDLGRIQAFYAGVKGRKEHYS